MKKTVRIASFLLLLVIFTVTASAAVTGDMPIFYDGAGVVSDAEASAITAKLESISDKHELVVAIAVVDTLGGKSARAYADDYYDYNNFAYDGEPDGVLLLVSMTEREWYITTTGDCIEYFSDDDIYDIGEEVAGYLGSGDYAEAFEDFAERCDETIYDATHFSLFYIAVSVIVGVIIGLIVVSSMKSKMKSVRYKAAARDYVREGSLNITESRDTFLYRKVNRVKRESSSGSSTHRGSSGRSHGGGGGKF